MHLDHDPRRPRTADVMPLVRAYLEKPGNGAGGTLHVVLDDGNVETSTVLFCLDWAMEQGDVEGAALALVLLAMSPTQRRRVRHG